MKYHDYYKTLGVSKNASEKEIKSAYRKLARKYHPDMNPDNQSAEARFKEINEAYEVLGDPEKRSKYDQLGANWNKWQQAGGSPNDFDWQQWMGGAGGPRVNVRYGSPEDLGDMFGGGASFSDFFTSIFGGMGGGPTGPAGPTRTQSYGTARPTSNYDLEHELEISLSEAYHGTTRIITKEGRRLNVKIPAGAKTGTKIRMRGEGNRGFGGKTGDLYLKIKVASDPRFERKGKNLYTEVPVDLYTAVLGGDVVVPTMTGNVKLKIPAGAQNGQKFRLRGKGMPLLREKGEHGDLFATIKVTLPQNLSAEQRHLFEELRELEN